VLAMPEIASPQGSGCRKCWLLARLNHDRVAPGATQRLDLAQAF
jgi:hypothetical protein